MDQTQCRIDAAGGDGEKTWVVRGEGLASDREWMKQVAADLQARTLFAGFAQDGKPVNYAIDNGVESPWTAEDENAAAQAAPTSEAALTPNGLKERIATEFEENFDALAEQLRSPMGVIPFVGAGMSKGLGFADWGDFLKRCATGAADEQHILALIAGKQFEDAAEQIAAASGDRFQRRIAHIFGREVDESALSSSPLPLLARLTNNPVITTNFDRVLEQAFRLAGKPFEDVISGPQPDSIVRAIHQNRRVLLKIHGDCLERTQRTFTREEYDQNWGERGQDAPLGKLAWLMFANRPLLFLGYSLETDRTVEALAKIHQMLPGLAHYAMLAAPCVLRKHNARRAELDSWGIIPLWFQPGHFGTISETLTRLITAVSVRRIADSAAARKLPGTWFKRFRYLFLSRRAPGPDLLAEEPPAIPDEQHRQVDRIARGVVRGRVVFFLGAGAHLGSMPGGNEFYTRIAERFGCADMNWDRSAVARYVIDRYGHEALVEEARGMLSAENVPVSLVFQFLDWLSGVTPDVNPIRPPLTIFTTNQDNMLERVFNEAGHPFHEFKYIGTGPLEGKFAWRDMAGKIFVVERPDNLERRPSYSSVILKMNGGFSTDPMMPDSVLLARGDFEKLAGRLPDALPAFLRSAIRDNSLLFLGHGLHEPDVEALIRYSSPRGILKSWAVHRPGEMRDREDYLENCGLELIPCELAVFVRHLYRAVDGMLSGRKPLPMRAKSGS